MIRTCSVFDICISMTSLVIQVDHHQPSISYYLSRGDFMSTKWQYGCMHSFLCWSDLSLAPIFTNSKPDCTITTHFEFKFLIAQRTCMGLLLCSYYSRSLMQPVNLQLRACSTWVILAFQQHNCSFKLNKFLAPNLKVFLMSTIHRYWIITLHTFWCVHCGFVIVAIGIHICCTINS